MINIAKEWNNWYGEMFFEYGKMWCDCLCSCDNCVMVKVDKKGKEVLA